MGLRADVTHELSALDTSSKALRKFGLTVGGVFAAITALGIWKHWAQSAVVTLGSLAAFLLFFGLIAPALLRLPHRLWMTFALALGWCMSRLILTILFVFAVIPVAMLGRVMRLPFIQIRRHTPRDSYWVDHPTRAAKHHADMF
ncbi:MAG: hypothetical protein JNN17_02515 [Verrucomicrobiaceae bacterium]|nr:hypothetical protein [Verrucomicrobiaceae bacterium]